MSIRNYAEVISRSRKTIEYLTEDLVLRFMGSVITRMDTLKMSRSSLAGRLNTSPAYVSKVLSGESNLSTETMVKLAQALDCDIELNLVPKSSGNAWKQALDKMIPTTRLPDVARNRLR